MTRIHDKIRAALEENPALTQKGLAIHMGLNPAAINRMLHGGRKIMAEEIPVIEAYIGQRLATSTTAQVQAEPIPLIPVYRLDSKKPFAPEYAADHIPRHPAQGSGLDAFAIFITDDSMSPRYHTGEIAYIHPSRPPEPGRDILALPQGTAPLLAKLLQDNGKAATVETLHPKKEISLKKSTLQHLYAVVGRG